MFMNKAGTGTGSDRQKAMAAPGYSVILPSVIYGMSDWKPMDLADRRHIGPRTEVRPLPEVRQAVHDQAHGPHPDLLLSELQAERLPSGRAYDEAKAGAETEDIG